MTAFSVKETVRDHLSVSTEIRSYNSKYLDLALRMPHGYGILEERVKKTVSEKISRGRIELKVGIRNEAQEAFGFEINLPKARAYYNALTELNREMRLESNPSLELILKAGDIINPVDTTDQIAEMVWPVLESCLIESLDTLNTMRKKEGDFIAADFEMRLNFLEAFIEKVEHQSEGLLEIYRNRLKDRISTLMDEVVEVDPVRISQEAAILADKSDISEEITRARSHIRQFRLLMKDPEPAGRKLNFLLQEFNREFNTMGSKSSNADLSHIVVDAKSEVEKIREQVQNIE